MKRTTVLLSSAAAVIIILPATILGMGKGRLGSGRVNTVGQAAPFVGAATVPVGVAAVVNDQTIPISKVSDVALREQGASILDQLIGDTLIHQEAKRRSVAATDIEIDQRIEQIGAMIQPKSLDELLKVRHISMEDFRSEMQSGIEVKNLLSDRLKPVKMTHVRDIFVNISPFAGMAANLHTAAQAYRIMSTVRRSLKEGVQFEELAKRYGDDNIDGKDGGDLGIVTNFPIADQNSIARGFSGQPAFLKSSLSLKKGQVVGPVRTRFGLHLIQAISTGDDPFPSEETQYRDARARAIESQVSTLAPKFVEGLKRAGKVTIFLGTGKPGHDGVAARVNGERIPTSHVVNIALATVGPMVVEPMIRNMLVDQEAAKQHVIVIPSQIDAKISEIRQRTKLRTLEDILRLSHTTMAELRNSQKAKIETEEMIARNVGRFRAAHIRNISILIKHDTQMTVGHSEAVAKSMLTMLQSRLKSGAKFEDLAKEYSEDFGSKAHGGDLGIVTEKDFYEPSILTAALALKKGEITGNLVKTSSELHLLQAVSTDADHAATEDAVYDRAQQNARSREIQTQVPAFMRGLRSRGRVINYLAPA
ncbi:MAG: peptidylprolyl isomerase [Capsulimonas sp.]|uniref:peptidylprolyl isomerase n=1 Tax=Capsulimonas sp. TaxID=2494211 RepID=UPI0032677FF0